MIVLFRVAKKNLDSLIGGWLTTRVKAISAPTLGNFVCEIDAVASMRVAVSVIPRFAYLTGRSRNLNRNVRESKQLF